jgi:hypothetical protein
MHVAFKKAFDKLLKINPDMNDHWDYGTETHLCFFDGRRINVYLRSSTEENDKAPASFSFAKDDDPALLEQVDNDLLLAAYIGIINFQPWNLLNDETNPVNAENWLVITNDDPIEIYVIDIDRWSTSQPYWTLTKAKSLPKDSDADAISKAADKVLKNEKYFAVCSECSAYIPAGYMHSDTYCMGCAQLKYNIIY